MRSKHWRSISLIAMVTLLTNTARSEELEAFTEPYHRVAIPASEIGVIDQIMVQEGDAVSSGQVLAKLDDDVLQMSLKVAQAAKEATGTLQSAQTEVSIRQNQLTSYRELRDQGNATQREFERAEADYHQSASRLQSVREELEVRQLEYERVKVQIDQRVIKSPIRGFVVAIDKEVGEFVSPTDPVVMHVVHLENLKTVFSVPLAASKELRVGQTVQLTLGYERTACEAVIEFVSPIADAESGSVRVKLRIDNQEGNVQSGVVCRWNIESKPLVEKSARVHPGARSFR